MGAGVRTTSTIRASRAEILLQVLLTKYPHSNKISEAAYNLGDIYESKANQMYRRAAWYFARCFGVEQPHDSRMPCCVRPGSTITSSAKNTKAIEFYQMVKGARLHARSPSPRPTNAWPNWAANVECQRASRVSGGSEWISLTPPAYAGGSPKMALPTLPCWKDTDMATARPRPHRTGYFAGEPGGARPHAHGRLHPVHHADPRLAPAPPAGQGRRCCRASTWSASAACPS